MRGDNVYYKDKDGNYQPFGVMTGETYLTDGVWRVHHSEGCYGLSNMDYIKSLYKIADEVYPRIEQLAGLEEYVDAITRSKDYIEYIHQPRSTHDIIRFVVGKIFEISELYQLRNAKGIMDLNDILNND